jgi:hypothetical protein
VWHKWREQYDIYALASGINEFVDAHKKAILFHFLDVEGYRLAVHIVASTDTYHQVPEKLDEHFELITTTALATIKFNDRRQQPGETIEQFYISLCELADHCEFGSIHQRILRDRFIVGVTDNRIRERLLIAEDGVTVDHEATLAKQIESYRIGPGAVKKDDVIDRARFRQLRRQTV